MAITSLTTILPGDSRSSSVIRGNFKTIRKWLNGAVSSSDIVDGSVSSRHIFRTEHYPGPLQASLGVTGDVYARSTSFDKANRNYHFFALTAAEFTPIPNMATTVYIDSACNVEVVARFYAWGLPSSTTSATEYWGVIGLVQMYHGQTGSPADDTPVLQTKRRIACMDPKASGSYAPLIPTFDKKSHTISCNLALSAGYHHIYLGVRCYPATTSGPRATTNDSAAPTGFNNSYKGVIIEGRSMVVEVHRK